MPIEVSCECGRAYRVSEAQAGKRLRCKACGSAIAIPVVATQVEQISSTPPRVKKIKPKPAPAAALPMDQPIPLGPNGSGASNPARAAVDLVQYFYCYPGVPLFIGMFALVGLIGAIASGKWWVLLVCILAACIRAIRFVPQIKYNIQRFRSGNVNPAIVLPRERGGPWKVAVFADMDTGTGQVMPAIHIGVFPLARMAGGPPMAGMRLVAPTLYGGYPNRAAWSFIRPMIANCSVRNPLTLNRLNASIPEQEWRWLEEFVPLLPSHAAGLHPFWPGGKFVTVPTPSKIQAIGFWFATSVILIALVGVIAINPMERRRQMENNPVVTPMPSAPVPSRPVPSDTCAAAGPASAVHTPHRLHCRSMKS